MWMKTSHRLSIRPASRTSTRVDASALSRFASALPAEPPPTMTKSWVSANDDRLQLAERLHRRGAADAADAARRARAAAEREVRLPIVRRLVDVHPACLRGIREAQPFLQVTREDRREKPVRRGVRQLDRVLEGIDGDNRCHRPESLLLRDERLRRHVVEDGRLPV